MLPDHPNYSVPDISWDLNHEENWVGLLLRVSRYLPPLERIQKWGNAKKKLCCRVKALLQGMNEHGYREWYIARNLEGVFQFGVWVVINVLRKGLVDPRLTSNSLCRWGHTPGLLPRGMLRQNKSDLPDQPESRVLCDRWPDKVEGRNVVGWLSDGNSVAVMALPCFDFFPFFHGFAQCLNVSNSCSIRIKSVTYNQSLIFTWQDCTCSLKHRV